jgi:hypothetical protein
MTIAISMKVNDGVVLAADSASTLFGQSPTGEPTGVVNVYNHANKVFNLKKGLPVGAITWGSGSIGTASISTLAKDFRARLSDQANEEWRVGEESYTVAEIAERLRRFMFEEHYVAATADWPTDQPKPDLGFVVAGYSAGAEMPEEHQVLILDGEAPPPLPLRQAEESGLSWNGQPEAITRLLIGFGSDLPTVLQEHLAVPPDQIGPAIDVIRSALELQLVQPAMPFQDAIDLAEFLVDFTIKVSRFAPGAPTVGGPIEIAAISKHEGFKWIRRKHYFTSQLNPPN